MVGKLAAGTKRRGRPRKKCKGRPPSVSSSGRQQPPSPLPASRRSLRRRRPRCAEDYARYDEEDDDVDGYYFDELLLAEEEEEVEDEEIEDEEDEDAELKRRGKKFKLLQKLPNLKHHRSPNRGSSADSPSTPSVSDDDGGTLKHRRKRKVRDHRDGSGEDVHGGGGDDRRRGGSGGGDHREGEDGRRHTTSGSSGSASGRTGSNCPVSTPLPDKKILEKVLDKLQKKDTYGVFAEPVDPEELPDYNDIIEHPMDFGTIRKKLSTGIYANLEEIKKDIFLLCTNAMEYNAPDTIYFRQARCIQELARKKFQMIRSNREDIWKRKQNIQSNSVTKKPIKSSLCMAAPDPAGTESNISSAAIPASTGNSCTGLNAVQDGPTEQPLFVEGFTDDILCENRSEKVEETSAKNSPIKLGRKSVTLDEDRRATYTESNEQPDNQFNSLFSTIENESKNLVAVGLDAEYSYARSLSRFAGALGPIAWRIASEKLEKALPKGVKFGPGWVGEYEPLPTPVLSFGGHSQRFSCHAHPKHKAENWKNRTMEGGRKDTPCVATESPQLCARAVSDSSSMGIIDGKSNHPKEPVKQVPYLCRSKTGSQPVVSKGIVRQHNSFSAKSTKDYCNTGVGTGIIDKTIVHNSSSVMGKLVDISAQRPDKCRETATSGLDPISSSKNNVQSSNSKPSDVMAYRPESSSSSSCMETRGMSNIEALVGNSRQSPLAFLSKNEMKPGYSCFNHVDHLQAVDDPVEVMKVMSRIPNKISSSELMVSDNQKLVKPPGLSPRGNSSTAATVAARAWMSVGRPSQQKSADASELLKMDIGEDSTGNVTSESIASAARSHGDGKTRPMPSISHAAAEEPQSQNRFSATFPQFILTELSRFHGQTTWRGLVPHVQQKDVSPPDLNISFHSPGSPVLHSGILVDSQQPDLALQL